MEGQPLLDAGPDDPAPTPPHLELLPQLADDDARGRGRARRRGGRGRGGRRGRGGDAARARRPAEALRARDRRRPPADAVGGARAGPAQGPRRRGGQAEAHRMQPPPRHVDHPELHEGRRAPARPDPGGQPRPHPRGREVRLPHGLQALDVRDLVDPPGGDPGARRPGPHHPPPGARGRAGAPRDALAADPRAEVQPRPDGRRARQGERLHREARPGAARPRRGPGLARDAGRGRGEPVRRHDRGQGRREAGRDHGDELPHDRACRRRSSS